MLRGSPLSPFRQAAMSSGVQAGFVTGALLSAIFGLADRYDPRQVFAISALCAALANASLIWAAPGSFAAVGARFVTGSLLAGVYPVGMKRFCLSISAKLGGHDGRSCGLP
jgi:MFS family permease